MAEGISIREFARRDGCDDSIVRRKLKSGHLVAFTDGSLDPALVGTDWRTRTRAGAGTAGKNAAAARKEQKATEPAREFSLDGRSVFSKAEAERIKENSLALMRRLELDKAIAAVVEIDDVVMAVVGEYSLVRNKLLNISSKIAPRAAALRSAEEIKALIDGEIATALEELTLDGHGSVGSDELRRDMQRRLAKAS
ncbi:hypothetical protein GTW51_19015 [Aurantimonas aggregata]|uniref:Terminase small subunit n=1 Tax=Aurantimonas aggregata TaxID=2047720 RepID=A0A6L9MMP5_9HYPH|nr:hypothetical protein [Aurantimonas aggregata]NDV88790.1 hypothetical protein [Aurantimonas aggregata]